MKEIFLSAPLGRELKNKETAGWSLYGLRDPEGWPANVMLFSAANGRFSSVDKFRKNCLQLKQWVESHDNIETVKIKYWGDLDPTGHFLGTNVIRALKFYIAGELSEADEEPTFEWNNVEFEFERVAINEEHVEDFGGSPLVQEDKDMHKNEKNKDTRFKKFKETFPKLISRYGNKFGIQLEAMTTTDERLEAFKELIEETIDADWDEDVWNDNCPDEEYDYEANGEEEPEDTYIDEEGYDNGTGAYDETFREMMERKVNEAIENDFQKYLDD
jgi:hypothetical protein